MLDLEGDTLKQMVRVVPPLEVPLDLGGPRENHGFVQKIPSKAELQLKRPHPKTPPPPPRSKKAKRGEPTQKTATGNDALLPAEQKFIDL